MKFREFLLKNLILINIYPCGKRFPVVRYHYQLIKRRVGGINMSLQLRMQKEVMIMNIEQQLSEITEFKYHKKIEECTDQELYYAVIDGKVITFDH